MLKKNNNPIISFVTLQPSIFSLNDNDSRPVLKSILCRVKIPSAQDEVIFNDFHVTNSASWVPKYKQNPGADSVTFEKQFLHVLTVRTRLLDQRVR